MFSSMLKSSIALVYIRCKRIKDLFLLQNSSINDMNIYSTLSASDINIKLRTLSLISIFYEDNCLQFKDLLVNDNQYSQCMKTRHKGMASLRNGA